jgi:type I restriction enzyme, S subunit
MSAELRPGYKLTEVGVIPEDWDVSPLAQLADIRGGIAKNENVAVSDPVSVHYLRVANVQDGYLSLSEMSKIQLSRKDLARYTVLPGDVLMNEGGDLDKLGRGAIWRGEFNPCVHQNHVFVVRCKENLLPDYLNVWTATSAARRFFLLAGKQTTNLASISKSSLGELPVAVPMNVEQRAIAAALGDVDALLGGLDRLIAKKQGLKVAAMQQLLTGQTRLPGFSGEWEVMPLSALCGMKSGEGITSAAIDDFSPYPCYGGNGLRGYTSRFTHEGGFALIGRQGALCGNVVGVEGKFFASEHAVVVTPNSQTDIRWLTYVLATMNLNQYSESSAQPGLSVSKILMLDLDVPPTKDEQTAIAAILSDMDAELAALQARRSKTQALKQAMMQELLTGKIRLV